MFFYTDTPLRTNTNINVWNMNGTKGYVRHYGQKMYLRFMAKHGTRDERWQAEKELVICDRKLTFWEKHPNFVAHEAQREVEKINKEWFGKC